MRRKRGFFRAAYLISLLFCLVILSAQAEPGSSEADAVAQATAMAKEYAPGTVQAEAIQGAGPADTFRQKLEAIVSVKKPEEEYTHEVDSFVRYMPRCKLKSQPGQIAVVSQATEYSYQFKAWGKLPVEFGIGCGYINIDKSQDVPLSLPNRLTSLVSGAQVTLPFFNLDKAYIRFRLNPSFLSDNWNASSSSFRLPAMVYGIYQPNQKLTLILGLAGFPSNEDPIVPIAGAIYLPNDKLSFNIIPPRPSVSYNFTGKFSAFIEAGASGDEYKVNKDEFAGKTLQYNQLRAGGGLEYDINDNLTLSASAGFAFNRYLKYRDSLGKVNMDNDLYVEFRVEAGAF